MGKVLDVVALRSFVAVADCGGFHRAATSLHLSQPTISHHVRRLEDVSGQTLMQRDGRYSRVTAAGEVLLAEARRMLAIHDETLRKLGADTSGDLIVGSTEHAADQLLPELAAALQGSHGLDRVRFRLDRGMALRDALTKGEVDIALMLGRAEDERSADAGLLAVHWYSAPGWSPPADGGELQLVAFDEPCALRRRALETLARHEMPAAVVCDAAYLAGVLAAARAGLGVALLATVGRTPEGLVRRTDLPDVPAIPLSVSSRRGLQPALVEGAAASVRRVLESGSQPNQRGREA
jgi:DNA-binding transcriptional LysR family regulator